MTLKHNDGRWSAKKITALCTIIAALATAVSAAPTFFSYCRAAIAPWTSLPDKVEAIQESVAKIEFKLDIKNNVYTTNKSMAYEQSSNH